MAYRIKGDVEVARNLHISGNLTVDGTSPGGSGGNIWQSDVSDVAFTTGSIEVTGSTLIKNKLSIGSGSVAAPNISDFSGDTQVMGIPYNGRIAARDADGNDWVPLLEVRNSLLGDGGVNSLILGTEGGSDPFGSGKVESIVVQCQQPSGSETSFQALYPMSGNAISNPYGNSLLTSFTGGSSFGRGRGKDVALYVQGTINSKDTSTRGTAEFGGDVHVSGNLTYEGTRWQTLYDVDFTALSSSDIKANGNLAITGTIGAATWIRENSNVTTLMSISNGVGLIISHSTAFGSDFFNSTRTSPLILLRLSGVLPQNGNFSFDEVDLRVECIVSATYQNQDFEGVKTYLEISSTLGGSPYNLGVGRVHSTVVQTQFTTTTAGTSVQNNFTYANENIYKYVVRGHEGADIYTAVDSPTSVTLPASDQYKGRYFSFWANPSSGRVPDPAITENLRDLNFVFVCSVNSSGRNIMGTMKRFRLQYRRK